LARVPLKLTACGLPPNRLTFNFWTVTIGRTSCELPIEASHGGELRMRVKQVLVFISALTGRATVIPPALVSRMHRFSAQAAPAAETGKGAVQVATTQEAALTVSGAGYVLRHHIIYNMYSVDL
jgi:hypothetical protein